MSAHYYHMSGAFLLIYISLFCNPIKKVLESKVLLTLGKYSMSFYVIHFTILMSVCGQNCGNLSII